MSAHPQMTAYLAEARWFAGKGRTYDVVDVQRVGMLPGPPAVTIDIITVQYTDADDQSGGAEPTSERYQLPLSNYAEEQPRIHHAYLGPHTDESLGPVHSYDAVHDREAMAVYLDAFARTSAEEPQSYGGVTFHRVAGYDLDTVAHSTLFSGEQSNSSVAFGEDSLMKVFRKVTPGRNPDIEIHRALTAAGNPHVAHLYGWLEAGEDDLAMIQQFLRTASDGWELALASARNLFAEADLHADEVGGDFAGEAHRLGVAVSEIHGALREHFDTEPYDGAAAAGAMRRRLVATASAVPALADHVEGLQQVFARIADATGPDKQWAQRVHGDLHLGQTLRTSRGWKLVDFEGEPAKPLAERQLPDSPWRDVAGMLRSFDYAAQSVVKDLHSTDEPGSQINYRAHEWVQRNREAFLAGYVEGRVESGGGPLSADEQALIDAYEADKAVYEVLYEARNRPTWLDIPLGAIERIGASR
jgi:maltokinase